MKVFSWLVGIVTLLATGSYLFVYVYRWEWHRALLVGVLFLACLVALTGALVLRRLSSLEQRLAGSAGARSPGDAGDLVLQRLRAAPVEGRPFPWLTPEQLSQTHVFIPVLLGGGVIVSALAWLVERAAGHSARAGVEAELADELNGIVFPPTPLVPTDAELLACDDGFTDDPRLRLLLGPAAHRARP